MKEKIIVEGDLDVPTDDGETVVVNEEVHVKGI